MCYTLFTYWKRYVFLEGLFHNAGPVNEKGRGRFPESIYCKLGKYNS